MKHPLVSLIVAIILFGLGGLLLTPEPDAGTKAAVGPDGQLLHRANGLPMMVYDHYQDLRVNGPAYVCFAGAATSLAWTVFLVGSGIVALIRRKPNHVT